MIKLNDQLKAIRNKSLRDLKNLIESYDDEHLDYLSSNSIARNIGISLDEFEKMNLKDELSYDECIAYAYGLGLKVEFIVVPYSRKE